MSQDDPQQPDRNPTSPLSRDTLLLLGALAFLILAVALTFLFTPGSNDVAATTPTTAGSGVANLTPIGATPDPAYPDPAGSAPTDSSISAYPAPGDPAGGAPSPGVTDPNAPGGSVDLGATASAFALSSTAGPLDDATPAAGATDGTAAPTADPADDPYPQPDGSSGDGSNDPYPQPEGQPPAQPTFDPVVVTSTSAAPPPAPARPTSTPDLNSSGQQPAPTNPPATNPLPTTQPTPTQDPSAEPSAEPTGEPLDDPTAVPADNPKEPPAGPSSTPFVPAGPPPPPVDVLRGNVRWAAGQSPIVLRRDVQIAPGAELIIEPGVEVRIDPGVSIYVDGGRMLALGLPNNPVRFVGNTGARWSGIYGLPGSFVVFENSELRGGGAGGTVMAIERGELIMRSSKVNDNGGAILLTDTKLELLNSEIAGNDMPYGAALDASYSRGSFVTLRGNRIAGNLLSEGAPMVRLANQSTFDTLNIEIDGNLLRGGEPNLQLSTNGPLKGVVRCNGLIGEGLGLGLRTQTVQVGPNGTYTMDLRVEQNFIDEHIPPVIPVYLKYGLGRGATSEILVDMRNNWWGERSGPYEPDENADGRGDSVGENINFVPWLDAPPPCAPSR